METQGRQIIRCIRVAEIKGGIREAEYERCVHSEYELCENATVRINYGEIMNYEMKGGTREADYALCEIETDLLQ